MIKVRHLYPTGCEQARESEDVKPRGRNDGANHPIAYEKSPDPWRPSGFADQESPYTTRDGFGRRDNKRRTGRGVV